MKLNTCDDICDNEFTVIVRAIDLTTYSHQYQCQFNNYYADTFDLYRNLYEHWLLENVGEAGVDWFWFPRVLPHANQAELCVSFLNSASATMFRLYMGSKNVQV